MFQEKIQLHTIEISSQTFSSDWMKPDQISSRTQQVVTGAKLLRKPSDLNGKQSIGLHLRASMAHTRVTSARPPCN